MSTIATGGNRTAPELAGQVALITGAAHGQGRASALALAREGVNIVAVDVAKPLGYPGYPMGSPGELKTLVHDCRAQGVECLTFAADVRHDDAVHAAVQAMGLDPRRDSAVQAAWNLTRGPVFPRLPTARTAGIGACLSGIISLLPPKAAPAEAATG